MPVPLRGISRGELWSELVIVRVPGHRPIAVGVKGHLDLTVSVGSERGGGAWLCDGVVAADGGGDVGDGCGADVGEGDGHAGG